MAQYDREVFDWACSQALEKDMNLVLMALARTTQEGSSRVEADIPLIQNFSGLDPVAIKLALKKLREQNLLRTTEQNYLTYSSSWKVGP